MNARGTYDKEKPNDYPAAKVRTANRTRIHDLLGPFLPFQMYSTCGDREYKLDTAGQCVLTSSPKVMMWSHTRIIKLTKPMYIVIRLDSAHVQHIRRGFMH